MLAALLGSLHILGLQALGTRLDLELHLQTLIEGTIPVHLDGGEMHKHIFTSGPLDESETLCRVEPLNYTFFSHY
jgi:hypothetical protein